MPHFEIDGGLYFVTFRLRDALPRDVLERLKADKERMIAVAMANGFSGTLARAEAAVRFSEVLDLELDRGRGDCYLYNPKAAVARTLCDVLHSWKSFSTHEINKLLGRHGPLFQKESFDRVVRDVRELEALIRCTDENPARAGLMNWPFHARRDWWLE